MTENADVNLCDSCKRRGKCEYYTRFKERAERVVQGLKKSLQSYTIETTAISSGVTECSQYDQVDDMVETDIPYGGD